MWSSLGSIIHESLRGIESWGEDSLGRENFFGIEESFGRKGSLGPTKPLESSGSFKFTDSLESCESLGPESSSGSSNPSGPSNPLGPRSSELFGFKEFKEASIDSKNSFASEESPGPRNVLSPKIYFMENPGCEESQ